MRGPNKEHKPRFNLVGRKYTNLAVIEYAGYADGRNGRKKYLWKCKCDCGGETIASGRDLERGHAKSCGCLHAEQMDKYKTINYKHGRTAKDADKRPYTLWCQIKNRCNNENDVSYRFYGAKGIKMCAEWENDPDAFCEYVQSLEHYGEPGMTIDRISVYKGYEPGNLRWITLAEQQKNKRTNRFITCFGKTMTISDWGTETGIDRRTILFRIKNGWPAEKALTIKPKAGGHYADGHKKQRAKEG